MRILVIGYGNAGRRHAANVEALGHTVVIHDPPLGREVDLERVAWGADAVIVCTPPAQHLESLLQCQRRGMPCLIEKPFCLPSQSDHAQAVYQKRLSQGVPVMVGHNAFWNETWKRFKDQLREPTAYSATWANNLRNVLGERPDTYQRHAEHGGVLLDCVQDIALALDVVGPVTGVTGHGGRAGYVTEDANDWAFVSAQYPGGTVRWQFDYLRPKRLHEHLAYGPDFGMTARWDGGGKAASDASYRAELADFLIWVKTGREPEIRPDPFAAIEVVHAAS